jgi:hypothetical protein
VAKLTVYIPDDLLDRARALDPGANTSQLVQRGLERLSPPDDVPYARRPADSGVLLAAAAEKLRAGAGQEYERGYRAALAALDERSWLALDELAGMGFDLRRWAAAWKEGVRLQAAGMLPGEKAGFYPPDWFVPMANDLGRLLVPVDFGRWDFTPTGAFVEGYQAALRDAWEAAENPDGQSMQGGMPVPRTERRRQNKTHD